MSTTSSENTTRATAEAASVAVAPPEVFKLNTTPASIVLAVQRVQSILDNAHQTIIAVPINERTLENTLLAFHRAHNEAAAWQVQCTFPSMVHANLDIRAASTQAKTSLKHMFDASYTQQSVYTAIASLSVQTADNDIKRLHAATIRLFERNGLHLALHKRLVHTHLRQKITSLESLFTQNINENISTLLFSREELDGCSDAFLSGLVLAETDPHDNQQSQRYIVSMKTPNYLAILSTCKVSTTRQRMFQAYQSRCPENRQVLAQIIYFRHLAARCFYNSESSTDEPSHALYRLAVNMAQKPSTVISFLNRLANQLESKWQNDISTLKGLKEKDNTSLLNPSPILSLWDIDFYTRQLQREKYNVDEEKYETLFSLRFTEISGTPNKWHPDVLCFTVHDIATSERNPVLLGHFFLDLYPREGKYGHQCVAPLMPACTYLSHDNKSRTKNTKVVKVLPIACNVGNLSKPTTVKSPVSGKEKEISLLRFTEARTFFHEFGHVVHCLCTRSNHALFSWSWSLNPYPAGVEIDFLELPSQMLENWLYDSSTLARLSAHHETNEPLPFNLQQGLAAIRHLNSGYIYRRQCFMSLFDMEIHSAPFIHNHANLTNDQIDNILHRAIDACAIVSNGANISTQTAKKLDEILQPSSETIDNLVHALTEVWEDLQYTWTRMNSAKDTWLYASWYHLAGYDAGYYSYLWSAVFSHDCFSLFSASKDGCNDKELGMRYRRAVLNPGANVDGMNMVTEFLGREPNDTAFLKHVMG